MKAVSTGNVNRVTPIHRSEFFSDELLNKVECFEDAELSKTKIRRAFKYIDTDNTGGINRSEFQKIISLLNVNLHHSVFSDIFNQLDSNSNGTIELNELQHFLETPLRPEDRIRCDFAFHLDHPSLFRKFQIWNVKSQPLTFTLSPGASNTSAYFENSSDPEMARCLRQGARLFYINAVGVENASYKDIESTLRSIHCPFPSGFPKF